VLVYLAPDCTAPPTLSSKPQQLTITLALAQISRQPSAKTCAAKASEQLNTSVAALRELVEEHHLCQADHHGERASVTAVCHAKAALSAFHDVLMVFRQLIRVGSCDRGQAPCWSSPAT